VQDGGAADDGAFFGVVLRAPAGIELVRREMAAVRFSASDEDD